MEHQSLRLLEEDRRCSRRAYRFCRISYTGFCVLVLVAASTFLAAVADTRAEPTELKNVAQKMASAEKHAISVVLAAPQRLELNTPMPRGSVAALVVRQKDLTPLLSGTLPEIRDQVKTYETLRALKLFSVGAKLNKLADVVYLSASDPAARFVYVRVADAVTRCPSVGDLSATLTECVSAKNSLSLPLPQWVEQPLIEKPPVLPIRSLKSLDRVTRRREEVNVRLL